MVRWLEREKVKANDCSNSLSLLQSSSRVEKRVVLPQALSMVSMGRLTIVVVDDTMAIANKKENR